MHKQILMIATGGTIASGKLAGGLTPVLTSEEVRTHIPEMELNCTIDTIQVCNIDSTNMTAKEWLLLAKTIRENYEQYDGFVICHGTDTLAYTACALSYLVQNSRKPIVLTGAQKPINVEITDAKTNLRDSIIYACDKESLGVTIVFDGKVIVGTRGKKMKAKSYHAFASINYPCIAVIQDDSIIRYIPQLESKESVKFYDKLNEKVFLLKLTPSSSPEILPFVFENYDCIILESFGVGGIPDKLMNEFENQMNKYKPNEKTVILTTQVVHEGSDVGVYEVGHRIKKTLDVLEAYDMTLEAVLTKIMWILGREGVSKEETRALFYTTINSDIKRIKTFKEISYE